MLRAEVVNKIFQWHKKYELRSETLYITLNLMDRYLSQHDMDASDAYLLAITCMLISTKYEEIYPPTVKDFIRLVNGKFNRE